MIKELSSVVESLVALLSILYFYVVSFNNGVHSRVLKQACSTQVVTRCPIAVCCFK